jgi:hypothetical protein
MRSSKSTPIDARPQEVAIVLACLLSGKLRPSSQLHQQTSALTRASVALSAARSMFFFVNQNECQSLQDARMHCQLLPCVNESALNDNLEEVTTSSTIASFQRTSWRQQHKTLCPCMQTM